MSSSLKAIAFWAFMLLCLVVLWGIVQRSANVGKMLEYSYSDLFNKVQNGQLQDAIIRGNELRGHLKTSRRDEFRSTLPANHDDLLKAMLAAKVNIDLKPERSNLLRPLLITFGPITLLLLLFLPPFRVIFEKAGFQPVLSILMLVPLVNLLLLYFVAFSEWKSGPAQNS
jgi:ATP-dependent Zn protease